MIQLKEIDDASVFQTSGNENLASGTSMTSDVNSTTDFLPLSVLDLNSQSIQEPTTTTNVAIEANDNQLVSNDLHSSTIQVISSTETQFDLQTTVSVAEIVQVITSTDISPLTTSFPADDSPVNIITSTHVPTQTTTRPKSPIQTVSPSKPIVILNIPDGQNDSVDELPKKVDGVKPISTKPQQPATDLVPSNDDPIPPVIKVTIPIPDSKVPITSDPIIVPGPVVKVPSNEGSVSDIKVIVPSPIIPLPVTPIQEPQVPSESMIPGIVPSAPSTPVVPSKPLFDQVSSDTITLKSNTIASQKESQADSVTPAVMKSDVWTPISLKEMNQADQVMGIDQPKAILRQADQEKMMTSKVEAIIKMNEDLAKASTSIANGGVNLNDASKMVSFHLMILKLLI